MASHHRWFLPKEFAGKLNVVYQFFPLEAKCNSVVEKDKHAGACDLSYLMAADTARFATLYDDIFRNLDAAKFETWRTELAKRQRLEYALRDSAIQARVHRLIATGSEYERTSDKYAHGIRSTPTMIVNGRMIIGTLPLPHMRAIFQALLDAAKLEDRRFLESWLDTGCSIGDQEDGAEECAAD